MQGNVSPCCGAGRTTGRTFLPAVLDARDPDHNAYAHYGIRNRRYKLVYWYNEGLGQPGTMDGGEEAEWELFDCERDPLELTNVFSDPAYEEIAREMIVELDRKMAEIGDTPMH